jgi:hypothetical protein
MGMPEKEKNLSPEEYQARGDAARAIVARKYCDLFGFWRECRYKPCRSARRCIGDVGYCLQSRVYDVPYDIYVAAQHKMAAEAPAYADRFLNGAHFSAPSSLCLLGAKTEKMKRKERAEMEAKSR